MQDELRTAVADFMARAGLTYEELAEIADEDPEMVALWMHGGMNAANFRLRGFEEILASLERLMQALAKKGWAPEGARGLAFITPAVTIQIPEGALVDAGTAGKIGKAIAALMAAMNDPNNFMEAAEDGEANG